MATSPDPITTESGDRQRPLTANPKAVTKRRVTVASPPESFATIPVASVSATTLPRHEAPRFTWVRSILTALAVAIITVYFFRGAWVRGSALLALFAIVICVLIAAHVRAAPTPAPRQTVRVLLLSLTLAMAVGVIFGLAGGFSWSRWHGLRHTTELATPVSNGGHALGNRPGRVPGATGLAFAPDGSAIAEGSFQGINVIDLKTEEITQIFEVPNLGQNTLQLIGIAWMSNGRDIAATYRIVDAQNNQQFGMTIWSASTGDVIDSESLPTLPISLSWSPNNELLAIVLVPAKTTTLGLIEFWGVSAKQVVGTFFTAGVASPGMSDELISWSPDSSYLAMVENQKSFVLVDPTTGVISLRYQDSQPILALSWSPNGLFVATGHADSTTSVFDMHRQMLFGVIAAQSGPIQQLSWSPSGQRLLIVGTDRLLDVDAPTLRTVRVLDRNTMTKPGAPIQPGAMAVPATVTAPTTGTTPTPEVPPADHVLTALWSPDGKYICARFGDDALVVWSTVGF